MDLTQTVGLFDTRIDLTLLVGHFDLYMYFIAQCFLDSYWILTGCRHHVKRSQLLRVHLDICPDLLVGWSCSMRD